MPRTRHAEMVPSLREGQLGTPDLDLGSMWTASVSFIMNVYPTKKERKGIVAYKFLSHLAEDLFVFCVDAPCYSQDL